MVHEIMQLGARARIVADHSGYVAALPPPPPPPLSLPPPSTTSTGGAIIAAEPHAFGDVTPAMPSGDPSPP